MKIKHIIDTFKANNLQIRPSQQKMIEATYSTLKKQQLLCVEAPTGTGKTLSYLLAAYHARQPKQYIIVSTATIALQTQLINEDLPLLEKLIGKKINFSLAKGRRRYVCHARLYDQDKQTDLLEKNFDPQNLQHKLETHQWNGDRDTLTDHISHGSWQSISTDASGCSGKRCSFYEDCIFYKARRKQHVAEIIVTNHSLLLSDLELGGGAILPSLEKCIFIIDECHHLPQKAIDHFSKSASVMGSIEWINQLIKTVNKGTQLGELDNTQADTLKPLTHTLIQSLKTLDDYLDTQSANFIKDEWLPSEQEHQALLAFAQPLSQQARQLFQHCDHIKSKIEQKIAHREKNKLEPDEELNRLLTQLLFINNRAQNLMETWAQFCHIRQAKEAPIAKWISHEKHHQCHTAPINVSKTLQLQFWNKLKLGAILCSATIRSLGDFKDFYRRSGLATQTNCSDLTIEPFFDYSRSILYIPEMKNSPQGTEQTAHQTEATDLIQKLILPQGGTLALFTSIRSMEQVYDALPDNLALDILMQTHHSREQLIKKHKRRIDQNKRSILFGLASLGEGLDLPAHYCQHVIIFKLPFSVPTTPIEKTRNDWLTSHNKNAFMLSTLPETSLRLTQFVGRLIRRENDTGIITILDKRLYTRQYGTKLLNDLPPFTRLINQPIQKLQLIETDLYKLENT
jgi:ATP-dependent DNA helicase DinG